MKWLKFVLIPALLALNGCASMGMSAYPLAQLTEKYTDDTSKFLAVDDLIIHYRDEGTGPTLVLLHGVASSLHTWDDWVDRLVPYYRIIRIDLPGHGLTGSDPSTESYEIPYMIDKLEKFLNKLSIDDIYLAGNSLGGYVAWNYALHRPDRVKKMVLLDAAGFPQDMPFIMSFAALPVIGEMAGFMMPKFIVNMNVNAAFGDDDKVTDALQQRYFDLTMRQGNREALVSVFRTMKEQTKNPHLGDRVKEVKTPTLLMWGDQDEWVPLEVMKQFEQALPNSQSIVYEGVGHMPMEELPIQTSRDAHGFFTLGKTLSSPLVLAP
ncbi:MAG: alpha/beta hydrolase [Oleispira antarctica]|uniref:Predicted hydrolase n=1 Tax=Oleispira antarctica RB-8 TaxID=698738 RepID=R4YN30_OLEAN|nr:alpha/beta hydrolase [Oleispira antarctica]MBQ0792279.1 alpha/beta hydrolase [Oleispira antarctica]CCK76342.1 Predicted hydrolase [Oleispira antarctica RB-8]